jgi:uncharacterized protein YkwD
MFKKLLIVIVCIAIFTSGVLMYTSQKKPIKPTVNAPQSKPLDCSFSKDGMIQDINSVRTNKVQEDSFLDTTAQNRANSLTMELDDHAGFAKLVNSYYFSQSYSYVGEILASSRCASTEDIFLQWKMSPEHWEAIENEQFNEMGVGFNPQGTAVVIFGQTR